MVGEHEYRNISPPPPIIELATALQNAHIDTVFCYKLCS